MQNRHNEREENETLNSSCWSFPTSDKDTFDYCVKKQWYMLYFATIQIVLLLSVRLSTIGVRSVHNLYRDFSCTFVACY